MADAESDPGGDSARDRPPPPAGAQLAVDSAESSPARSVDSILESSFRGALGDLDRDPNAFIGYMAQAREIKQGLMAEIDCRESRVTRAQAAMIGASFDKVVALLEKVVHINGWLIGTNMALKESQRSLREEVVAMVVEGVKGEVKSSVAATKVAVKEAVSATVTPGERGYAAAVKGAPAVTGTKKRPKSNPPVVLVFPENEPKDSRVTREVVKKTLCPQEMGVQVRAVRSIRDGGLAIETATREQMEKVKAAPLLKDKGFKVQEPRVRGPKVLIYDVPEDIKEEALASTIWGQNFADDVDQDQFVKGFKVVRRAKSSANITAECSGEVRNLLRGKGRIFVGWGCCRVVDFVFPLRCNRCCAFGHTVRWCTLGVTCLHCAEEGHGIWDCPNTNSPPKCICCLRAKKPANHSAKDKTCPCYTRAQEREFRSTAYSEG